MTETITLRLRRPKRELQAYAKPNLNSWLNDLIDKEVERNKRVDWAAHFERRNKGKAYRYCADEVRRASR